jgi:hypothetical protein
VAAPPEPAPSRVAEGYRSIHAMYFSPRVLPWIAPACLLLIFFLTLFPWVGVYPGGVPWVWGSAWGAAFNIFGQDHDLDRMMRPILSGPAGDREDAEEQPSSSKSKKAGKENEYSPGWNPLLILYCFLLLVGVPVAVASVAVPWLPKLPPAVDRFLPWRWGIVAALCLVLFLFLFLQMVIGFSIESKYTEDVNKYVERQTKGKESPDVKQAAAEKGRWLDDLSTTTALKLAVFLHLLAITTSLLMFWVEQRGTHRPPPRLEVAW